MRLAEKRQIYSNKYLFVAGTKTIDALRCLSGLCRQLDIIINKQQRNIYHACNTFEESYFNERERISEREALMLNQATTKWVYNIVQTQFLLYRRKLCTFIRHGVQTEWRHPKSLGVSEYLLQHGQIFSSLHGDMGLGRRGRTPDMITPWPMCTLLSHVTPLQCLRKLNSEPGHQDFLTLLRCVTLQCQSDAN